MKKEPFENTPRVEWKNGAWRYRPRKHELPLFNNLTWYKIGTTEVDVYHFLAEQSQRDAGLVMYIEKMGQALNRYASEVIPKKSKSSRKLNLYSVGRIRKVYGILYQRGKLRHWDSEKKPKWYLIPWDNELELLVIAVLQSHKLV